MPRIRFSDKHKKTTGQILPTMKKFSLLLAALLAIVSCGGGKKASPKAVVIYFSQQNSTKAVAETIASSLGAPTAVIEPVVPYDGDYGQTVQRGQQEIQSGALPEIKPLSVNVEDYDIIFLGYPIWFGTYAPPVKTFLTNAHLDGKKIVPFCTFGSGGLNTSVNDLKALLPNSEILPGYGVRAARMDAVASEVDYFLRSNGYIEGDFTPLPAFSGQSPVTEAEASIFDEAVKDYAMIKAKAKTVCQRDIPSGKEYLFTATNLTPEGEESETSIQVYVTVPDGGTPVFTQVLR